MDDSPSTSTAGRRKLPARYFNLVLPLLLSALMTCVVSLISTWRSVGLIDGFLKVWLGAWGLSWVVAFPLLLVMLPLARTATRFWVDEP
jgi:hypothetical protein